jgi:hypothetical protein
LTCCDKGWGEDVTQKLNHLYFIAFADWPADKTGLPDVKEFDSPNGKGVTGKIDGKRVLLGNRLLMESEGVDTSAFEEEADQLRKDGATVIFAAVDGRVCGLLAIADPVKETTRAAIAALKKEGIRVVMLTGDHRTSAEAVARNHAQYPTESVFRVRLQHRGRANGGGCVVPGCRRPTVAHHCRCGHVAVFGERHYQRPAIEGSEAVKRLG